MRRIYLDDNASTPTAPEVATAMRPFLGDAYANPSSGHRAGKPAREAVERARGQVANLLGCASDEVVFTGGGEKASLIVKYGEWTPKHDTSASADDEPEKRMYARPA